MRRSFFALAVFALTLLASAQDSKTESPSVSGGQTLDRGSGIELKDLSSIQTDNLVVLGKVWGFLKYHHPKVTSGELQWDYELFRILPSILDAHDHASANAVLAHWIEGLGPITPCKQCATLDEKDLYLRPDLSWISNQMLLGDDLSQQLQLVYRNRPASGKQFYVSKASPVGNPDFRRELDYTDARFPDAGFQLLGLYRYWNIIQYWAPDRDLVGEDWTSVLADFIPRVALARDFDAYQLQLMALIAMAHDSHSNLWSSLKVRPPVGECRIPATFRFVENRLVVTALATTDSGTIGDLKIGDIVTDLDGSPVPELVAKWGPYYAASNGAAMLRDIAAFIGRGACGDARVAIQRQDEQLSLTLRRQPAPQFSSPPTHDLPGPAFRRLSKDIAYLKLSSVKADDAAQYIASSSGTKGLIIDIRNYPSEFVVFALGSLLISHEGTFARFTIGDLANPGAFHWGPFAGLAPQSPHYSGRIVILVDEVTQSSAEYTTMAFRLAPGAIVVGSTTAGADGNVSRIPLPGGLQSLVSGIGVFYPNQAPTQRIGIVPDVEVRPTIAGIRANRDEVLEEAIRKILGRETPNAEIQKLYLTAE